MISARAEDLLRLAPFLVLAAVFFSACSEEEGPDDRVVARAFEEHLLWSDLRNVVPFGISPADSTALAQQFIRNWMKQRTVLHQAEQNLPEIEKNFESQLRDYRNSLVIYTYEQALVQQKLDTVVDAQEMEQYHAQNKANFELREPIMRVRWAKVRENDKRIVKKLQEHFLSGDNDRMHELEMWLAQRSISFVDRMDIWTTEAELRTALALADPDKFTLNATTGRTVHREGSGTIFLEILELRSAGEVAPIELVAADIRSIIINQRKLRLLEKMREDLYTEALEKQQIEIL